jgi:hypothetical protein
MTQAPAAGYLPLEASPAHMNPHLVIPHTLPLPQNTETKA